VHLQKGPVALSQNLAPDMFCVTHETQERFRACAGPGWNSSTEVGRASLRVTNAKKRDKIVLIQLRQLNYNVLS
jgi:hypothetical protein